MTTDRPTELRERLARVRLLALDVDGVLTDGGLYYTADGLELKRFDVKDGYGLKLVMAAGVAVAIISAGRAEVTRHRAGVLGITHVLVEVEDKLAALHSLCATLGYDLDAVAFVGDDLNDIPALQAVGLPIAVGDSMPATRRHAALVTTAPGGRGAVREVCDALLAARETA